MQKQNSVPAPLKRAAKSHFTPYILLYIFFAVCHLMFVMGTGDDAHYALVIPQQGLINYLIWAYKNWSARTLVDIGMCVMNWLPGAVWQLLNPLMITAIPFCILKILGKEKDTRLAWFACCAMLMYPWQVMDSAGWITTTTVYLWPAAFGVAAMVPLAMLMRGETPPRWLSVLSVPFALYAANMELLLVIIFPLQLGCVVYMAYAKHKHQLLPYLHLAASAINIIWIALCPGTKDRFEAESVSWFPNIKMYSIFSKTEIGFSTAMDDLIFSRNFIFFFFAILLCWAVFKNNKNIIYRAISCIPLAATTIFGMYQTYTLRVLPSLSFFTGAVAGPGSINLTNANSLFAYLPMLLLYFTLCAVLASLYLAFGHSGKSFCAILLLCLGIASRAATGFGPTVAVSGTRTSFFLQMCLVVISVMLYADTTENTSLATSRRPNTTKSIMFTLFTFIFAAYALLQIYSIFEMRITSGYF